MTRQATRRPGDRAGIDLSSIVAAARTMRPAEVTMQAVADRLGVDRKAVNHHVGDRETLLGLVALDAFATRFSTAELDGRDGWPGAVRAYAAAFVDSMVALGPLADHLTVEDPITNSVLRPVEDLLRVLAAAGFDDATALRALVMVTALSSSHARDVLRVVQEGERPRLRILRHALGADDRHVFPALARIAAADPVDTYQRDHLEFTLEVLVEGLRRVVGPEAG